MPGHIFRSGVRQADGRQKTERVIRRKTLEVSPNDFADRPTALASSACAQSRHGPRIEFSSGGQFPDLLLSLRGTHPYQFLFSRIYSKGLIAPEIPAYEPC
jgi:hypothetical protein